MKEKILSLLKENTGTFVSGEELSNMFSVSRTAVWKAINQLKSMGYEIESQTKRGYRLIESPDYLSAAEIDPLLTTSVIGKHIMYFDSLDSTNNYAKKLAGEDFEEGTVVIAEMQTAGRGRLGRSWISPRGKGIWMTIMLKPDINPLYAQRVTLVAACAVNDAIKEISGIASGIKWPNDIVANGKKLCGILTEMGAEVDAINYLIVGIGINANLDDDDIPAELAGAATSIKIETGKSMVRKEVVAAILNRFEKYYTGFSRSGSLEDIVDIYKSNLLLLGKQVRAVYKHEEITGEAVDINDAGQLLLRLPDGTIREITSGEVSVRGIYGYA
ncbi:MAG: biotin--[acetyl-CoA-carboxylase] ligase [Bacillota bacterium]